MRQGLYHPIIKQGKQKKGFSKERKDQTSSMSSLKAEGDGTAITLTKVSTAPLATSSREGRPPRYARWFMDADVSTRKTMIVIVSEYSTRSRGQPKKKNSTTANRSGSWSSSVSDSERASQNAMQGKIFHILSGTVPSSPPASVARMVTAARRPSEAARRKILRASLESLRPFAAQVARFKTPHGAPLHVAFLYTLLCAVLQSSTYHHD